ncbi:hypothetical protein [Pseudomonas donghuensis]|uniref:hypothetical protein n=1 Tax=Pseudomonas donghuensis TaxID=1163398 RepID=UPI002E14F22B|nr:hypothetical protein VP780_10385 [Pseudomonas donghuensis]
MSEQAKRDKQAAIDAVVGGALDGLASALCRLSKSDPSGFLSLTGQLLDTEQHELFAMLCGGSWPEVFHAEGMVYGATYIDAGGMHFLCKRAHPVGSGLPFTEVQKVAFEARAIYDEIVLKKVVDLKAKMQEIDLLLKGHSFVDGGLAGLAHADLVKGQALLVAALTAN